MRTLYGRANSSNVLKAIWLLEELGLPHERVDLGGAFGGTDTPEYRAMNPNGLVPTLVEDGFAVWESNTILRYLCDAHAPDHPFWPREPRARATIDRWLDWQQSTLTRPQSTVFLGLVRTPPERRDEAAIAAAVVELGHIWGLLDAQLAGHAHVAGPQMSLADVASGVSVHRWFSLAVPRPELPHLRAWYERLLARPAYARHVAGPLS